MPRLTETLLQILKAEHEAEALRRRALAKPAMVGAAGLMLALVGLGAASAAVGPAVSRGADLCLPLLSGQSIADLAAGYGLEQQDSAWVIAGSESSIEIAPPGRANPQVCALYVSHTAAETEALFDAVDQWASKPSRELMRVRDREPTADGTRLTSAWTGQGGGMELAVILSKETGQTDAAGLESTVVITAR